MDVKPLSEINNRRDLEDTFQTAMSGAHHTLSVLSHFEKEQNLPKSYLIEFHPKSDEHFQHSWTTESIFSALKQWGPRYSAYVRRTKDDSLFFLQHSEQKHSAEFIIDCLNPRFLIFHTLSNAAATDRFIFERLTQYQPEFDLFWFPVSLLEHVVDRERVTGWEAQFNPLLNADEYLEEQSEAPIEPETLTGTDDDAFDEVEPELPARALRQPRISMRFERPDALNTYKELTRITNLLPDLPLNGVLAEREDEHSKTYARARIKSNGKITGRGVDFPAYLQIVNGTLDMYAEIVRKLESRFWINLVPHTQADSLQFNISGEPFCIRFKREIDIKKLIDLMFGCTRPFRLMGEAEQLAEDYFAVDAIDLHVNQSIAFEIAPRLMRIYLYGGTCGNTLVRIVRSLQHHIDSNLQHPPLLVEP